LDTLLLAAPPCGFARRMIHRGVREGGSTRLGFVQPIGAFGSHSFSRMMRAASSRSSPVT